MHPLHHLLLATHEAEVPARLAMADAAVEIPRHALSRVLPVVLVCITELGLRGVHAVKAKAIKVTARVANSLVDNVAEIDSAIIAHLWHKRSVTEAL